VLVMRRGVLVVLVNVVIVHSLLSGLDGEDTEDCGVQ
jgi:hypothetical protein